MTPKNCSNEIVFLPLQFKEFGLKIFLKKSYY